MHRKKRPASALAFILVALLLVALTACNRLTDSAISSATTDTYNAAGEATWAQASGAHDSSGNKVTTAGVIYGSGLPSGWTSRTGIQAMNNSYSYSSGAGTSASPWTLTNVFIYGCVAFKTNHIKLVNVYVLNDNSVDCYGGISPNGGAAAVVTGGNADLNGTPVTPPADIQMINVTVDGNNAHKVGIGVHNLKATGNDWSNSDIIWWASPGDDVSTTYIHDVAQVHLPGCTGYNDHLKDANNNYYCNPNEPNPDPAWHEDYHRDTIFAQASSGWFLHDAYVVHSHKHYVAPTQGFAGGTVFTDHSSGGCLCNTSGAWGPAHDFAMSNVYINGGGGTNVIFEQASTHVVVEHVRFDGADHSFAHTDTPANNSDYAGSGVAWPDTWPTVNATYCNDNSVVDVTSGSETAIGC